MRNILSWNQMLVLGILVKKDKSKKVTVRKLFADVINMVISLEEEIMSQSGLYVMLRKFEQVKYITVTKIPFSKNGSKMQDTFHITEAGRDAYCSSKEKYLAIFDAEI